MSYSLQYSPELGKRYPPTRGKRSTIPVRYVLIGLGLAVACYALLGLQWIQYLIPGDPQVTADAWNEMLVQVEAGKSIGESVHTFIAFVITHGA